MVQVRSNRSFVICVMYAPVDLSVVLPDPPDVPLVTSCDRLLTMLRRLIHNATRNEVNIQSMDRRISALHASGEDMDHVMAQRRSYLQRLQARQCDVMEEVNGRITSLQTQLDDVSARLDSLAV